MRIIILMLILSLPLTSFAWGHRSHHSNGFKLSGVSGFSLNRHHRGGL